MLRWIRFDITRKLYKILMRYRLSQVLALAVDSTKSKQIEYHDYAV